jgi:hypothetical protein
MKNVAIFNASLEDRTVRERKRDREKKKER